jgi:hypothetical protein
MEPGFQSKLNQTSMKVVNTSYEIINPGLLDFINSVDLDLGRDEDSLNLFEWVVEDYYEAQLEEMLEYFSERPDLQEIQIDNVKEEIQIMLHYFEEKEEYEKCARILVIKENIYGIIDKHQSTP